MKKLLRTFGVHRKKLRKIWVDGGYRGLGIQWVKSRFRYLLEVVLRSDDMKGFVVLPHRWVVERTFAWLNNHRRLSKDYERFTKTSAGDDSDRNDAIDASPIKTFLSFKTASKLDFIHFEN